MWNEDEIKLIEKISDMIKLTREKREGNEV